MCTLMIVTPFFHLCDTTDMWWQPRYALCYAAKDAKVFRNMNATTILLKLEEDHSPEEAYVYVDVGQKEKPAKRHSCPLEQLDDTTLETDHRGFLQSDGGKPFSSNTHM